MDLYPIGTLLIRLANAVVWTAFVITYMRQIKPIGRMARRFVGTVIIFGMWILVFGALTLFSPSFGTPARLIYTAFTVYALIVGAVILADRRDG